MLIMETANWDVYGVCCPSSSQLLLCVCTVCVEFVGTWCGVLYGGQQAAATAAAGCRYDGAQWADMWVL